MGDEMIGKRFGRLEVISFSHRSKRSNKMYLCQCDCGNTKTVYGGHLRAGSTKSCGCTKYEYLVTHGLSKHPLFRLWMDIKKRCFNNKHKSFGDYGGRGITVCDEWKSNFKAFFDFCISNGWAKGLQIDRINNDLGYSQSNCRFVTQSQNVRNARKTKWWVIEGRKYDSQSIAAEAECVSRPTIMQWCGILPRKNGEIRAKDGCFAYLKYGGSE